MNLLLLLSALLSALTGAVPGVRRAEAPQAVAQALVSAQTGRTVVAQATQRPLAALPSIAVLSTTAALPKPMLAAPMIWTTRRRE
jgi:hypothetical protein